MKWFLFLLPVGFIWLVSIDSCIAGVSVAKPMPPLTGASPSVKYRQISKIVFMGDSLTDDGGTNSTHQLLKVLNGQADSRYLQPYIDRFLRDRFSLYSPLCKMVSCKTYEEFVLLNFVSLTKHLDIPIVPAPPYIGGKFSNGPVWAEYLTTMLGLDTRNPAQYVNRSHGGSWSLCATDKLGYINSLGTKKVTEVVEKMFAGSLIPPCSDLLVQAYLREFPKFGPDEVVVYFFGGNDYLNMHDNPSDVVKAQKRSIEKMIRHGARHIVWVNMPDMTRAPRYLKADYKVRSQAKYLISLHNQWQLNTLNQMKAEYGKKGVNLYLLDARALFRQVLNNAIAFGITNVTDACAAVALPGVGDDNTPKLPEGAVASLVSGSARVGMAPVAGAQLLSNPQLANVFRASESKPEVCAKPDQYAFWDDVHPTTHFHKIFADVICNEFRGMGFMCNSTKQPVMNIPAYRPVPAGG